MKQPAAKRSLRASAVVAIAVLAFCGGLAPIAKASCGITQGSGAVAAMPASHLFQAQMPMQTPSIANGNKPANTSIVGLWIATFYSGGQVFDQGFDQWHSDGTEILNDTAPPQPANGAGTVCLGVFEKTGPRTYKLRHPFWSFDANANLVGTGVILEQVTVDQSGNSYSGPFTFLQYDLSGNLIYEAQGTIAAQRITVD